MEFPLDHSKTEPPPDKGKRRKMSMVAGAFLKKAVSGSLAKNEFKVNGLILEKVPMSLYLFSNKNRLRKFMV